jgi:hypothetical protein
MRTKILYLAGEPGDNGWRSAAREMIEQYTGGRAYEVMDPDNSRGTRLPATLEERARIITIADVLLVPVGRPAWITGWEIMLASVRGVPVYGFGDGSAPVHAWLGDHCTAIMGTLELAVLEMLNAPLRKTEPFGVKERRALPLVTIQLEPGVYPEMDLKISENSDGSPGYTLEQVPRLKSSAGYTIEEIAAARRVPSEADRAADASAVRALQAADAERPL